MRNVAGGMDDPHSHLELDRTSGLRWPLIVALSRRPPPRGCTNEVGLARSVLPQEIGRLVAANVTFVSTEHWFPDLTAAPLPRLVKLVVVFRDPMQRLLSSYLYHGCGDNRCPATARCRLSTWFEPVRAHAQRRPVWARLDAEAVHAGLRAAAGRPAGARCRGTGASQVRPGGHTRPAERAEARRRVRAPPGAWLAPHAAAAGQRASCGETALPGCACEVDAAEMARAREENRWDIELFGRARHAEASILRRVGCMARHLAPAGVDDRLGERPRVIGGWPEKLDRGRLRTR